MRQPSAEWTLGCGLDLAGPALRRDRSEELPASSPPTVRAILLLSAARPTSHHLLLHELHPAVLRAPRLGVVRGDRRRGSVAGSPKAPAVNSVGACEYL